MAAALVFCPALLFAQTGINLQWNTNSDPGFAGYFVYVGGESGTYTNRVNAGMATQVNVSGLTDGVTYFFVVTAYLADGTESDFSNEVAATPGGGTLPLQVVLSMSINTSGIPVIAGTGIQSHNYALECTSDFVSWTTLTNSIADENGNFAFEDRSALPPARAYRAKDLTP